MRAEGRLLEPKEFGKIVVGIDPDGSTVRLSDVARVELGALDYNQIGRFNGKPLLVFGVFQTPGSNALAVANGVRRKMAELKQRSPADLEYASIHAAASPSHPVGGRLSMMSWPPSLSSQR